MAFLSTDLVNAVKRYSAVPTSQVTFENSDFFALADDSIRLKIVPLVLKHMAEFYVAPVDYQVIGGTNSYAIPQRAINMMLRAVLIVASNDPDTQIPLEQLNRDDLYAGVSGNQRFLVKKSGFYIEGNNVILYPSPVSNIDILRMLIFQRPNQLVDPTACGLITGINTVTKQITVSAAPSTWTAANTFDLIKSNPGFDCTGIDLAISNIAAGVLTFTTALPTQVSLGDYVCLAGQSCVVQVPPELHPLLAQYVVVRVLSAQGDAKLKDAIAELDTLEKNASLLLTPRVQSAIKRVANARGITRWV